ncbi:MAG: glycosyl transferase [Spirochaetaceae bacterium]|nr:glycosyl transferase [Spirochaetaceae bacterium]
MTYGFFDDGNREYVITEPRTPWPWINYLGDEGFFSLISNTGGGYSFYKDALYRRITRYRYNGVPADEGSRGFWIRESDGRLWSPGWKPAKTDLDSYECRHGLGYTRITGSLDGLEVSILYTVPRGENAEVQKVSLTNIGESIRKISFYSYVEFALWNAQADGENFQRNLNIGEVEIDGSTIIHKTEYRERRNHLSFYHSSQPADGFDSDRESFVGLYETLAEARCPMEGTSKDSIADGWSPIAAFRHDITLGPGESKDIVFVLGYVENDPRNKWESPGVVRKEGIHSLIDRVGTPAKVDEAALNLKEHWESLLSRYRITHHEEKLERMVNIWNQYQCMVTYNLARSASYFESGIGRGLGFRDTSQDLLGFVHQIPEKAKERILDVAATQFPDGGCYHQYQPLTKKGNAGIGGNFRDDPLWLIAAVSAYIRETGEWSFLDTIVPFDGGAEREATIFTHLQRSFRQVLDHRGPHGLPLIGRADWNDCLNLNTFSSDPNDSFQTAGDGEGRVAESVFIAGMFVFYGREYAEICRRSGRTKDADEALAKISVMEQAVTEHGWDGEWYLRAYDANGHKVGSAECDDGKILIEPQGFCAMAEIGARENMPVRAMDSAAKYLGTDHGLMILWPAYKDYHLELGEISSYPPGYKENGGIFCHNNPWVMIGEAVAGRAERAWDYYKRIAPAWREEISRLHRTEPYVYAQMIAGKEASRHGEAKNSWLTGTAAWNFVAVSQYILGVRPHWDGLEINPCVPADWDSYLVERFFRGDRYRISFRNESRSGSRGILGMTVDGRRVDGNVIRPVGDGGIHEVEVVF